MAEIDKSKIIEEKKIIKALNDTAKSMREVEKELVSLTSATQQFDKVTKKFTGTQKEVANNQKKLAENTKKLTETEKKQIQIKQTLQREVKKQRDFSREMAVLNDKESGSIARLTARNKLLRQERNKLNLATKAGRQRLKEINTQYDKNNKAIKKTRASSEGLTGTLKGLGKQILGAAGLAGGLTALFRVLKGGFATTFKFERAMSQVKAISGATKKEFDRLRQSAIDLGGSTAFTASQVAALQKEYSKFGFSAEEILAVTKATLDLAAATGEDLTQSATVAAATLRGFNLNAFEMSRVVDVMAKSFTSSALDLSKFQTAMQQVGPVANAVNKTLERSSAELSVLANAGLDASTSGTSLRNIYLELEKQGLSWEEALGLINGSSNKATVALELFGKRGATAALILAANEEQAAKLTTEYENAAGAAEEMAGVMLDNVIGASTKLTSAWEGLILRTNESTGAFKTFLLTLTDVISAINTKGKPALDSMFETRDIQKFGDKFKFFKDQGIGFAGTLVNSLFRGKEAVQELSDELAVFGEERKAEKEAEQKLILETQEIERKANAELVKRIEAEVAAAEKAAAEKAAINRKLFGDIEAIETETATRVDAKALVSTQKSIEANDSITENFKRNEDEKRQAAFETQDALIGIANQGLEFTSELFARQASKFDEEKQRELEAAGDNEEQREAIEEKFAKKQNEIRRKQAVADKLQALFNIGINTAVGIVEALPNVVLAALVGTLGALSAATVAASPIPQFWKGVKGFGGGMADVGERGREMIETPNGVFMSPDTRTRMYLPPGTNVIPNPETEEQIEKGSMPELKELAESNRMMAKNLKERPIVNNNITSGGISYVVTKGNSTTTYLNKYFRK